jgi:hypothetical protein
MWRKMTKDDEDFLALNEESKRIYDRNYTDRYEIIRNRTQIKFIDYNLLQVIRTFHIKDCSSSSIGLLDLFPLPEEYDMKRVLTHNLNIFLNDVRLDIMESNNESLQMLNKCHMVSKVKEYINKVRIAKKNLDAIKLNWGFKRIYKKFVRTILPKFENALIEQLSLDCSDYLKPIQNSSVPQKSTYDNLEEGNSEIRDYIKRMHKKIKIKKHIVAERIVNFTKSLKNLMVIPNLELIAIDLPKNFYNFHNNIKFFPYKKNHFTLVIKSEESFLKFVEYHNISWLRSVFSGESLFYLIYCYIYDTSSTYFEITPPENTRIASVKRDNKKKPKCNFMMETEESRIKYKTKVKFESKFNERLVIHIPRPKKHPNFGYMFSVRFRPYRKLQIWIFISFLLSLLYIGALGFIAIFLFFIEPKSSTFLVYLDIIDLAKFQAPWIYGLLIGNQLWLQKPQYLWKRSTKLAIIFIVCGILSLIACVSISSIIYHVNF